MLNKIPRWIRNIFAPILFLIGLGGIPDDLGQWEQWLHGWMPMFLDRGIISWVFMIVGGGILLMYLGYWGWSMVTNLMARIETLEQAVNSNQSEPSTASTNSFRPIRNSCPLTPKQLVDLSQSCTTDLARERALAPYMNTWLRIEGKVKEVSRRYGGEIKVEAIDQDGIRVSFTMNEHKYTDEDFIGIEPGDQFIAEGTFESASEYGIDLEDCEIPGSTDTP